MAIKTHKVALSLDNPRVIQSGINVQSFDKQSIQISIELTKNDEVFQVPSDATIRVSLLKLARQEQKIIVDVPNNNRDSIDWIVPDYLDGYQGTVRVGVYLVSGTENVDLGYFTILSNVSDIDKMADEFTDNVFQGWEQIEADLNELNLTIAQTKLDLAEDLTQIDNTIANINTLASDFTADVATKQSDVTSKYNAFDTDITEANQTIDDILALQPQFQSVLDETTSKDVISAPEIILARGGATTLGERLDGMSIRVDEANAINGIFVESYDGSNEVTHPSVLFFENSFAGWNYWMAYTPYPKANDRYENPSIACSIDGVLWFVPEGLKNPLVDLTPQEITKGSHYSDTHLVYNDVKNELECWYRFNTDGVEEKIFRKKTTDGVNWSAQELVYEDKSPDLSEGVVSPAIIFENGKYKMWFVRKQKIYYMDSSDAINWSSVIVCNFNSTGGYRPWHLDVKKTDLGYEILVNAYKDWNTLNYVLMASSSADGFNFGDLTVVLKPSKNKNAFDGKSIYRASFLKIKGIYWVYYGAVGFGRVNKNQTRWEIGLTTGESLYNLRGSYNDSADVSRNTYIDRNLVLRKGRRIDFSTGGAYFDNEKIKLVKEGKSVAFLKVSNVNGKVDVTLSDENKIGFLGVNGIQFSGATPVPSDYTDGMLRWFEAEKKLKIYSVDANKWHTLQKTEAGLTNARPTDNLEVGYMYFDNTLNKPIWRNKFNDGWVDSNGATV